MKLRKRSRPPLQLEQRCPKLTAEVAHRASSAIGPDRPSATHPESDESAPRDACGRNRLAVPTVKGSRDVPDPCVSKQAHDPQTDRARRPASQPVLVGDR